MSKLNSMRKLCTDLLCFCLWIQPLQQFHSNELILVWRFTLLLKTWNPKYCVAHCHCHVNLFPSFLRHTFWQYRKENPKTRVGEPPPDGLPGFNSGVMLLDLGAMRDSALYNQLLEPSNVAKLADQYRFRGHLGDQDFFTMIGMEHPELFYSLACGWNRQLCTWWRDHGYGDVFQLYYRCGGPVYIYHGNCNSPIPDDWWLQWTDAVAENESIWSLKYSLREIFFRLFGRIVTCTAVSFLDHCTACEVTDSAPCWSRGYWRSRPCKVATNLVSICVILE